eukprot:TRINITY_DN2152_c0_g3_i8.p1 TRINITY_DN2152_c0_g3~~TRINITY_DN2152_c0_g3_i8.p1  ORF type:complete len:116 (+),score=15.11 TRINITY_DN2152_c0_g3_i8:166-513(+)
MTIQCIPWTTNAPCPEVLLPYPLGTIVNLFKNRLSNCRLTGATIEVVLKLAHDFVYELADKANGICNKNGKKTIVNRHVLTALKVLSHSILGLSLIHICRCRRIERCRSRWSPYH